MTTIVAVKKNGKICIASDSLTLFGTRKELDGRDVKGGGKILQVGSNYIGMSGHPVWRLIFHDCFLRLKELPNLGHPDQIFEFFNAMHESLKQNYRLCPPDCNFLPFESSEFQLLIANPLGIFEVEYSRMVRAYSKYSAIGTGEGYALGAMRAIYDAIEEPEEIARVGLLAAAHFDRKTQGPFEIHTQLPS